MSWLLLAVWVFGSVCVVLGWWLRGALDRSRAALPYMPFAGVDWDEWQGGSATTRRVAFTLVGDSSGVPQRVKEEGAGE